MASLEARSPSYKRYTCIFPVRARLDLEPEKVWGEPRHFCLPTNLALGILLLLLTSAACLWSQYGAGVTKSMDCPRSMVGRVIGKGGETIKALQKQFQANIQIDQNPDPMKISIAGQPGNVEAAAQAVLEIINGGNPFGAAGPGGLFRWMIGVIELGVLPAVGVCGAQRGAVRFVARQCCHNDGTGKGLGASLECGSYVWLPKSGTNVLF
jgi:KH domain